MDKENAKLRKGQPAGQSSTPGQSWQDPAEFSNDGD
jgi:hypothetical protein